MVLLLGKGGWQSDFATSLVAQYKKSWPTNSAYFAPK